MPELPEVETIRIALRDGGRGAPPVLGRTVRAAHLLWERTLETPDAADFAPRISGQTILELDRRGKFLLFELSQDTLIVHLRMTGDLLVRPDNQPFAPHDRFVLTLDDGLCLAFNDPRKFGRAWLTANPVSVLGGLGPEPLDPDFTLAQFTAMLAGRHRQLKPLLLDQAFIAGLGNIYTDEALHRAGLHPLALSDSLTGQQSARLFDAIQAVLADGIKAHGSSFDWVYRGGDFQNSFRVYRRTGLECPVCGGPVERTLVGQRSTHFCPNCQPREK